MTDSGPTLAGHPASPLTHPLASPLAGLLALLTAFGTAPAAAQERAVLGPAPVLSVGQAEASTTRKIELTAGRSVIVDLPRDAKEVFVANPAVANAVVRSTRKVFVIGMADGATSIFILDAEGRQIAALDVTVARDLKLGALRQLLGQSIPGGRFDVRVTGDSILLSGSVGSSSEAQQAIDIANAFVGVSGGAAGGGGAGARGAVINNLTIRNKDQVMLRVTVVEVARTVLKQFGINLSGSWSGLNLANVTPLSLSGGQFPAGNLLSGTINGTGGASITATLRAFEQAGVSRVLAEPTLTAISGESANFTAGGELPVPSSQSCTPSLVAGTQPTCVVGISFKPYGVTLNFTPVVMAENRISVRVGTSVSEIDPQNSYSFVSGNTTSAVPGLTVRKSETTVELASGATMMTAGLIQQKSKAAINGLPGLVNLPILGALFRSRDYQRQETELMIMVTPYIAKAMEPRQVTRPDDAFVDATDGQAILLGQINRVYGTAGTAPLGRGYRGRVGFITD
ncbi:type II and III secretion system protein family protein [Methylobacterium sp. WL30]|nr:type II and III secretion system protein family protein [Methylobacterium sp. WL116]TXN26302.1 type II and III secretion system protein family protein [Methylobacterium sp. WL93]TXN44368.1 type II and III secretion system protein family protein [Methylobacterium sp. WL119]TXN63859.1 type II and III secretion system protein family protein [Methylobacterium sp. WL6]TXN64597.1 type II and III secretion system protein family protein [Methylobacterium sp. WL30]